MVDALQERVKKHIGCDDWQSHYGIMQPSTISLKRKLGETPDYSKYWNNKALPLNTKFDEFGVAMVPSGLYHFWGYISPLRNAQSIHEIEDYPIDVFDKLNTSELESQVDAAHSAGQIVNGWIGMMYENAWQIRGLEQFLMDLIDRPSWAECLLERMTQRNLNIGRIFAHIGVDYVITGDDVANQNAPMFSIEIWRQMMLSRWRRVWHEIKCINSSVKIWYHSDGNIIDMVPHLVDAGVDILNPLQPECLDIDKVFRDFGHLITLHGCIGTQSTMPFGTPAEVRNRVKDVINKYGRNGGLIIAPTHVLEPDVPIENIEAFCQACS
jgi:uroporphyrinogen decarboxylase